jgi:uncharacterized hydrophobic protein (TIGR00271 family)
MSTTPKTLRRLLDLRQDQADPETIDSGIRSGVLVGGTNLWVLMLAILIASIGLNVNSTAVIIGAMLISPLMGPIIGAGYGAGIQDTALIRQSLRNLGIFVGISLTTSTLYFVLSPLSNAQSELLARTTPTIWDVLIAFFGGAAGMVGLTRREKTTLIPGVAIATALMPPLCTAGYGLATGQPGYFLGAFFLFTINGVFIALATLLITRVLRLPAHTFADDAARRRGALWIGTIVIATLVPSVYLAVQLVRHEWFNNSAQRFLAAQEANQKDLVILARAIDPQRRRVEITVMGGGNPADLKANLLAQLPAYGLSNTELDIRQPRDARPAKESSSTGTATALDLQRRTVAQLQDQLSNEQARAAALEEQARKQAAALNLQAQLAQEIQAQQPAVRQARVSFGAPGEGDRRNLLLVLDAPNGLSSRDLARLKAWLEVRLPSTSIEIFLGKAAP